MSERSEAWLRLALTPGLGPKGYEALQGLLRAETLAPEEFVSLGPARREALWRSAGRVRLTSRLAIPSAQEVEPLRAALVRRGVRWLGAEDAAYPRRLAHDRHGPPPPVLFWRGDLSLLDASPTVGIVGRIDPSPEARRAARELAARLAGAGWLAVSGMARGIDRAAHEGALEGGGATAAFLPQGILTAAVSDPALADGLRSGRLLLASAWAPEAPWTASLAVRRNGLIAAASDGLVAAEMTLQSDGTRHTVREARRRGLEVWTLAHPRPSPGADGAEWLIRTGARPLRVDNGGVVRSKDFEALTRRLQERRLAAASHEGPRQLEMGF